MPLIGVKFGRFDAESRQLDFACLCTLWGCAIEVVWVWLASKSEGLITYICLLSLYSLLNYNCECGYDKNLQETVIKDLLALVTVWDECFLLKYMEFCRIWKYLNEVIMSSFPSRFPVPSTFIFRSRLSSRDCSKWTSIDMSCCKACECLRYFDVNSGPTFLYAFCNWGMLVFFNIIYAVASCHSLESWAL